VKAHLGIASDTKTFQQKRKWFTHFII